MRFNVVLRTVEDDYYVAMVPELPGCHTQAKSLDDLMSRIKEAILLYLETEGINKLGHFVGSGSLHTHCAKGEAVIEPLEEAACHPARQRDCHIVKQPDRRSIVIPVRPPPILLVCNLSLS